MTDKILGLILDIDGVIWRNKAPIGDLTSIFDRISELGIRYSFATNNSSKTIGSFQNLLSEIGVPVDSNQIFTSGSVTADRLRSEFPQGSEIFVIGMPGLKSTLKNRGFTLGSNNPVAVVVGLDDRFTYQDLKTASDWILSGVPFIGTNPDVTLPTPQGVDPGTGSILAAIQAATNKLPRIIGKPQPAIFENALEYLQLDKTEVMVVGDRLSTDIAGGQNTGCKVGMVLSGVTTRESARQWRPEIDIIADDLSALIEELYV